MIEEVKLVIKPHYTKKRINKEEYKEIMRKAVPKVKLFKKIIADHANQFPIWLSEVI